LGHRQESALGVDPSSSIAVGAASQATSTEEACSVAARPCFTAEECTLVVATWEAVALVVIASAGLVHHLLDLRLLHRVAYWVVLLDYCFLGCRVVVVIEGYRLASGTDCLCHRLAGRVVPSYHSKR